MPQRRVTSTVKKAAAPVAKKTAFKGTTKAQPVRQTAVKKAAQPQPQPQPQPNKRIVDRKVVTRVGNLTADPEIRFTANGTLVCSVDLAYNPYNPETKEQGDPIFYRLICFNDLGSNVGECLTKGMRVIAHGTPQINEWTDEEDNTHERKEIVCNALGPDLRWQKCVVDKVYRRSGSTPQSRQYEEEPF